MWGERQRKGCDQLRWSCTDIICIYDACHFWVTFLGCLSDPFKWLSDLHLGDEKVPLNHLIHIYLLWLLFGWQIGENFFYIHKEEIEWYLQDNFLRYPGSVDPLSRHMFFLMGLVYLPQQHVGIGIFYLHTCIYMYVQYIHIKVHIYMFIHTYDI